MKKEDIRLDDWTRILLGEAPAAFLVEVFIRSLLTYIILLVVLKLLGKRMSGKLTHTEMAVTLMFGAVVSSAMQIPDRGIVESCFVLLLIIIFQQLLARWTIRNPGLEKTTFGEMTLLVSDGVLQNRNLDRENISRDQLLRRLRSKHIRQLGELQRVYLETSGSFSLFKYKDPRPGLAVFPDEDEPVHAILRDNPDQKACWHCGKLHNDPAPVSCSNCGQQRFENAYN